MAKSSYNFVPLADKVFFPENTDKISHDIPFEDGEDGVIELTIENVSPLFVRNGAGKNGQEEQSSHITLPDGTHRYFIPGSSLKGCFRSVMEILAHGKMQQYNRDSFGIAREFDTRKETNKYYMGFMKNISCGWLQKKQDHFFLSECKDGVVTIPHDEIKAAFPSFYLGKDHESAENKQKSLSPPGLYPLYEKDGNDYRIVCTGYISSKFVEYLFSEDQKQPILIEDDVVKAFESVHKNTEYYGEKNGKGGFLKNRLHDGDPIPVFFTKEDGKVKSMGITRMFRPPYPETVESCVERCYSQKIDYDRIDLPEAIFGYSRDKDALRGRVTFTHAFCQEEIKPESFIRVSGVLGQPQASYYPYYLQQTTAPYKTYKDPETKIAGRKRYRIFPGNTTIALPTGNGNKNVGTAFYALPKGQTFSSRIILHNMRSYEIGALLSAITFHNTPGTFHNIGMAKAFGYGKVTCTLKLKGLAKSQEEYLRAFEEILATQDCQITGNESLNKLVAIASESHRIEELGYMGTPKEYGEMKKKENFSLLKEPAKIINSFLSITDIIATKRKAEQEELDTRAREKAAEEEAQRLSNTRMRAEEFVALADELCKQGLQKEARDKFSDAKELFDSLGEDTSALAQQIAEIDATLRLKAASLDLERKNVRGEYTIAKFDQLRNNVDPWKKKNAVTDIPQAEQDAIIVCAKRLRASATGKEKKAWDNPDDKRWAILREWLGDRIAQIEP